MSEHTVHTFNRAARFKKEVVLLIEVVPPNDVTVLLETIFVRC